MSQSHLIGVKEGRGAKIKEGEDIREFSPQETLEDTVEGMEKRSGRASGKRNMDYYRMTAWSNFGLW
jgi:hypothetical protein